MGGSTETSCICKDKAIHPDNLDCVPGGSSGGSAACGMPLRVATARTGVGYGWVDSAAVLRSAEQLPDLKPTYGQRFPIWLWLHSHPLWTRLGQSANRVKDVCNAVQPDLRTMTNMDATSAYRDYPDFAAAIAKIGSRCCRA